MNLETIKKMRQGVLEQTKSLEQLKEAFSFKDGQRLFRVLGQFLAYSAAFPGNILSLAALVYRSTDLFFDETCREESFADRTYLIVQRLMPAASEEIGVAGDLENRSHRKLAVDFFLSLDTLFPQNPVILEEFSKATRETVAVIEQCRAGYGVDGYYGAMKALGFHAMSELIAQHEFQILHDCLAANEEVCSHLKNAKTWPFVTMHCSAEEQHADDALVALEEAFRYVKRKDSARRRMEGGFMECIQAHERFTSHLLDLSR